MRQPSLREEIAGLRAEVEQLRRNAAPQGVNPAPQNAQSGDQSADLPGLFSELGELVQSMLDEAEESFTDHPVASISAALALGIVIGRLTAK